MEFQNRISFLSFIKMAKEETAEKQMINVWFSAVILLYANSETDCEYSFDIRIGIYNNKKI